MTRVPVAAALAALALLAAGCGGGSDEPEAGTTTTTTTTSAVPTGSPFAYDASRPLAVRDGGRVNGRYPIAVRDLSFTSGGRRVEAYLAVPPRAGRRPAAVLLHGSGGNREELLVHALWLAGRGAVTLTLTAPSAAAGAAPRGLSPARALQRQHDLAVSDVVAVRRALDLLQARPDVDGGRLGFLGYSAGGRTGAVLAGVEPRLDGLVLWSAGASPVGEYASRAPASLRPQVRRVLGSVDPLRHVARGRAGTLLLTNGRADEVVPREALDGLAAAAPEGTRVRWYDAGHALSERAYGDQLDWLDERLSPGPVVPGALTGP